MNELIIKSLSEKNLSFLLKIPYEMLNEFEKKIIDWIKLYSTKYIEIPTVKRLLEEFDFFIEVPAVDPIEDIFDRTIIQKRNIFFVELINSNQKKIRDGCDPLSIVNELYETFSIASGSSLSTRTHDRFSLSEKETNTFLYGIDLIDESTGGIAYGDYCLVVGRPGSKKTTFLEWIMIQAALCGNKILYISNENPSIEVISKLDAFFCGFNPIKLRNGGFSDSDRRKITSLSYFMRVFNGEIVVPEEPALTISDVISYVDTHNPDLIFIDGIYLMNASGKPTSIGWEEMAAASRALKRYARKIQIPIIGTIQAGRAAEGSFVDRSTIAGTDAFLQDADTVISLNNQSDKTIGQVVKSRWGETPISKTFELKIDYDTMFVYCESESFEVVDEW